MVPLQNDIQALKFLVVSNGINKIEFKEAGNFNSCLNTLIKDIFSNCNQEFSQNEKTLNSDAYKSEFEDLEKKLFYFVKSSKNIGELNKKINLHSTAIEVKSDENNNIFIVNDFPVKESLLVSEFNGLDTICMDNSNQKDNSYNKINIKLVEINCKKIQTCLNTEDIINTNADNFVNINKRVSTEKSIANHKIIKDDDISEIDINSSILDNYINQKIITIISNEEKFNKNEGTKNKIFDNDLQISLPIAIVKFEKNFHGDNPDCVNSGKDSFLDLLNDYKVLKSDEHSKLLFEVSINKNTSNFESNTEQAQIIKNSDNKHDTNSSYIDFKEKEINILNQDDAAVETKILSKSEIIEDKNSLNKILNFFDIEEINYEKINFNEKENKQIKSWHIHENELSNLNGAILNSEKTKIIEKKPEIQDIPGIVKDSYIITKRESNFIEISLKPEGIGKLHIYLSLDNGTVHAKIDACEIAGRDLINKNINDIIKVLSDEGISVGSFSVNLKDKRSESFEYSDNLKFMNKIYVKTNMPLVYAGKYIVNIFV